MPVLSKSKYNRLATELNDRFRRLSQDLEGRPLSSRTEGCKKGNQWSNPEDMLATSGSADDLSLAISDFKSILAEIKKLKDRV